MFVCTTEAAHYYMFTLCCGCRYLCPASLGLPSGKERCMPTCDQMAGSLVMALMCSTGQRRARYRLGRTGQEIESDENRLLIHNVTVTLMCGN